MTTGGRSGSLRRAARLPTELGALRTAVLDQSYASTGRRIASVHDFYRYPARFSPAFARAAIASFTSPGDWVLDPFVGGGTSLVEARLLGRGAVGADISQLSCFVTRAKTTTYSPATLGEVETWARALPELAKVRRAPASLRSWIADGYLRNVDGAKTWRIRNVISQALETSADLRTAPARQLARCAILRAGQWALDMRDEIPSVSDFRSRLADVVLEMSRAADEYAQAVRRTSRSTVNASTDLVIINSPLPGLARHRAAAKLGAPTLILTSPPYPGVYVNYHRWKVEGRWETPAPFWIAGCVDGSGITAYTMSARARDGLKTYFAKLHAAWQDLATMMDADTWLVQMVGFSEPDRQLPRLLDTMTRAGLGEVRFPQLENASDGRLWRQVPSRRWWVSAAGRGGTAPHTASEVLLVHRRTVFD